MIDNEIKVILEKRNNIHSEDYHSIEECWEKEIGILTADIDETIEYLSNRCTPEEYVCLSEVFDDIIEKINSEKLADCLLSLAEKFPKETEEYNIRSFIVEKNKR